MLKLTRNINQSIFLHTSDGIIEVTVCDVSGCQVRLGFDAPQTVNIVRSEILHRSPNVHQASQDEGTL